MKLWARFLGRRPLAVLVVCLLFGVAAGAWGAGLFSKLSNGGFEDPHSDSTKIVDQMRAHFGNSSTDLVVIYRSDGPITDPTTVAKVGEKVKQITADHVERAVPYFADRSGKLVGDNGRAGMVLLTMKGEDANEKLHSYTEIRDDLAIDGLEVQTTGLYPVFDEINDSARSSITVAEAISIPIVFVLSIAIFGSVVAALMPTMIGVAAIIGSFAVLRTLALVADINVFSVNIVTILGMGLAIDYALFVVTRFKEELHRQPDTSRACVATAIETTMHTAGRTVLFSGLTVAVSLASLLIFPQAFLRSMGWGGIAAVLVAMASTLTLLPAVLVLLGRRIDVGSIGVINRMQQRSEAQGGWAKLAETVMRRPLAFIIPIVIALVVMAVPFFHVKWGTIDAEMLPKTSTSRTALANQEKWFGTPATQATVLVTGEKATDQASIGTYLADLKAVPGVDDAVVVNQTKPGAEPATLVQVSWSELPQSEASQDLVRKIREVKAPGTALVGGSTAMTVDMVHSVGQRLPLMGALVAGSMFVLLFLAFGSVVIPLKALLMNILSIGASFGAVTWIFADGHLEKLLGFHSLGYLEPTEPLLMVAILFGLSMDYEVFLLSRIKEEYDQTGDNRLSVAHGLQRTGRLITSAAALLCVVVLGFAVSPLIFLKMVGVGMLVAIVLDATVVRALLVPSTMRLLGRWNWWAPPGLRWIAKHFSLGH